MGLFFSPLHSRHEAAGAKFAEFGGWSMPLEYTGGGVLAEHRAVREGVGLFDVSHLGKATVSGQGAAEYVNQTLTNDLTRISAGQAQYTLCCDETGGTVDDLIVYLRADDDVFLVPNASNTAEVVRRLAEQAPASITVENQHHDFAVLALQGPKSPSVLTSLGVSVEHPYMSFVHAEVAGIDVTVCRTGYTGEVGFELVVPASSATAVFDELIGAGEQYELKLCGLGARDTLRTEMGYPLHGHELSSEISPVMARAGWAVGWSKPEFWGKAALQKQREEKTVRTLRGLLAVGRGIPRPDMAVSSDTGQEIGVVTSGTFSPTLRTGIALALLDPAIGLDDEVVVDIRGRQEKFTVVKPPFVQASTQGA